MDVIYSDENPVLQSVLAVGLLRGLAPSIACGGRVEMHGLLLVKARLYVCCGNTKPIIARTASANVPSHDSH